MENLDAHLNRWPAPTQMEIQVVAPVGASHHLKDGLIVFKDYIGHKQDDDDVEDVEGDDQEEPG